MSLTTDIATIVSTKFPDATYALKSWYNANKDSYNIAEMTLLKPFIVLMTPCISSIGESSCTKKYGL